MPTRMDVSDASDEEDEVPMSKSRAQQQPLTSRGEIPTETAQEQAIDENQMINEEYKIWYVLCFVFDEKQCVEWFCLQEEKRAVSLRRSDHTRVGLANIDMSMVPGQRGVRFNFWSLR